MKNFFLSILCLGICFFSQAQNPEENLKLKNIEFPLVTKPVANYVNVVRTGNLLFLSGKGPLQKNGQYITGKLGKELSLEQGYEAARITALVQMAVLKDYLGDLNKVKRIVKVLGMVNSADTFYDQPKVINGFSDLLVEVFGEKGKHARSAVGMAALPMNMAVEIEMIVEIE
ncbi:MAG: RidA family protein [Sphingobacteriia bacterium]|nr:RidA family protein [Sphingobacteriia bacterium]